MMFSSKILAICLLNPNVWGTAAFTVQTPNSLTFNRSTRAGARVSLQAKGKSSKGHPFDAIDKAYKKAKDEGTTWEEASTTNAPAPEKNKSNAAPKEEVTPIAAVSEEVATSDAASEEVTTSDVATAEVTASDTPSEELTSSEPPPANIVAASPEPAKSTWDTVTPTLVQGGSLKTWSFTTPSVERVQVFMRTKGRPLKANIDLWQGPNNTPQKMRVFLMDGDKRPFCAYIETPKGQNTIAIRNTGEMEFPLAACVDPDTESEAGLEPPSPETIQGGSLKTYSFSPGVESVKVILATDGRPLNARIELLQGPNSDKQIVELYTEDGLARPYTMVIKTPGVGNVVRCINTSPVEFPMTASVGAHEVQGGANANVVVTSGSSGGPNW